MKKITTPIIISLLIVAILGVSVYASVEAVERKKVVHDEVAMVDMHYSYERKEAKDEKTIESPTHGEVEVTYKESKKQTKESVVDVYVDEENVEYQVDSESDKVIGYFDNAALEKEAPEGKEVAISEEEKVVINGPVTKAQAIKIASMEAKRMFPEEYEKFPFAQATKQLQEESYLVEFNEKWGEGDFAIARAIRVCVAKNGDIAACVMYNREALADVDESLLDGVTMEQIEEFVKQKLPEASYEIDQINVVNKRGEYSLYISVEVDGYLNEYYYELG